MYTEYVRPNGHQVPKSIELGDEWEKLYQLCCQHPMARGFSYEDCQTSINLCFAASVYVSDPDEDGEEMDTIDVVCEVIPYEYNIERAWQEVIAKASRYLKVDVQ